MRSSNGALLSNARCAFGGIRKTGPKENSSYDKTYMENSSENFLTDFFGKTMISADAS